MAKINPAIIIGGVAALFLVAGGKKKKSGGGGALDDLPPPPGPDGTQTSGTETTPTGGTSTGSSSTTHNLTGADKTRMKNLGYGEPKSHRDNPTIVEFQQDANKLLNLSPPLVVDGDWGPKTRAASVKAWEWILAKAEQEGFSVTFWAYARSQDDDA